MRSEDCCWGITSLGAGKRVVGNSSDKDVEVEEDRCCVDLGWGKLYTRNSSVNFQVSVKFIVAYQMKQFVVDEDDEVIIESPKVLETSVRVRVGDTMDHVARNIVERFELDREFVNVSFIYKSKLIYDSVDSTGKDTVFAEINFDGRDGCILCLLEDRQLSVKLVADFLGETISSLNISRLKYSTIAQDLKSFNVEELDSNDSISHFASICSEFVDIINDTDLREAFQQVFGPLAGGIENSSRLDNLLVFLGIVIVCGLKSESFEGQDKKTHIVKKVFNIVLHSLEGCSNASIVAAYLAFFAFEHEFSELVQTVEGPNSLYKEARLDFLESAISGVGESDLDQLFQVFTRFYEFMKNLNLPNTVYKAGKDLESLLAPKEGRMEYMISFFIDLSYCFFDNSSPFALWLDLLQSIYQNCEKLSEDSSIANISVFDAQTTKKFSWGNVRVEFQESDCEEHSEGERVVHSGADDFAKHSPFPEGFRIVEEISNIVHFEEVLQKVELIQLSSSDPAGPSGPEGLLKSEFVRNSSERSRRSSEIIS
jgi:hypothetical protein